ncbi:hypothetical protein WQ56_08225 [Luteimonas sp. FCS-9]|nr:hypothetical protein WQ56_08225 [Luteimonas sp. FCS-9]
MFFAALLGASGCSEPPSPSRATAPDETVATARDRVAQAPGPEGAEPIDWRYLGDDGVLELDWLQLLPADELDALSSPRPVSHTGTDRMAQYGSDRIVPAVLGIAMRLPGYVVPLETDGQGRVSELFLVPYYGACIHVPPPPPNQIVHVQLAVPTRVDDIYEAYWVEGELTDQATQNALAGTAYSMKDARLTAYTD